MNLRSEKRSEARFSAYVEGLASVVGHVDRNGPLRDYLHRPATAGRAQECGADGREDGSGTDDGAAPVVAAFCRCRVLVEREGVGQNARLISACSLVDATSLSAQRGDDARRANDRSHASQPRSTAAAAAAAAAA